jgi:hypothetical protein
MTGRRERDRDERPAGRRTSGGGRHEPADPRPGGSRAPASGGEAAGSAGGPGGTRPEVPQERDTGKGEDEPPGVA